MRDGFDIFVGGPMGNMSDDGAGSTYDSHIGALQRALIRIASEIEQSPDAPVIRINTPELDDTGMITSRIFGMLDTTELGVMDVSAGSPSVMYELAMLHALGTPTIPVVVRGEDGRRTVPFYLKDSYQAVVASFDEDELYERLKPMVQTAVYGGGVGANFGANPMSEHYGLPLVDISASTGLATGYFHNFVRHVIKQNDGVFTHLDGEIDTFVILKPARLSEAEGMKQRIDKRLRDAGVAIEMVGSADGQIYEDREQVRGQMLLWKAGRYLYDAPAPLVAQQSSPRFQRVRRMLRETVGDGAEVARATVLRFETQMIAQFLRTIEHLSESYPNCNPDYLEYLTVEEFVDRVRPVGS